MLWDILACPSWLWDGIVLSRHYDEFRFNTGHQAQSFDLDKLFTWFVILGNRERIVDGPIGDGVEDGTVYLIANRLVELLEGDRTKMELIKDSTLTPASKR